MECTVCGAKSGRFFTNKALIKPLIFCEDCTHEQVLGLTAYDVDVDEDGPFIVNSFIEVAL